MKGKITAFINELITYDYILFGSVFVLFILTLVLSLMLRKKLGLSIFLALVSFTILLLGPTLGYLQMHKYLFKNSVVLQSQKKLNFTKAVVVKGTLTNESKFNFSSCKISASAYKVSSNSIKNMIYPFKPFVSSSIIEEDIKKTQTRGFKIIVEPFTYKRDYNISLKASCK